MWQWRQLVLQVVVVGVVGVGVEVGVGVSVVTLILLKRYICLKKKKETNWKMINDSHCWRFQLTTKPEMTTKS